MKITKVNYGVTYKPTKKMTTSDGDDLVEVALWGTLFGEENKKVNNVRLLITDQGQQGG